MSETKNGLNIAVNADGTITVSGTATAETYLNLKPIPASLYNRLMGVTENVIAQDYPVTTNGFTFFDLAIQPYGEIARVFIVITEGSVVNRTYRPYIIKSAEPLPYEPYQGSVTPLPIPRPLRRVGDVKDKCVTRQDYESAEKLVVTYNVGFVELDGTEASHIFEGMFYLDYSASWPTPANRVNGVCSHYPYGAYGKGKIGLTDNGAAVVYNPNGDYTGDEGGLANWKAYLAAQKEAGTPVQVAYQLAAPEVYATDPLDIDNAAGPLTVVTGGQVEVKMTDFVTDRTPAFLNKLDKTGDGSDVTVTFTEAATDTDTASGDKLSILFGKILKRFTNILNGTTKVGYATKADTDNLGNQITETYANSLGVANNTIVLKNKIGENLSTITVPYANSAGNVATSIKGMGIAVQTASPYAWFLNYTGSGNKDGARKYYASVYADNATYSTSAGSSNNIVIYNNNWSGTDGSISAIYANAEKTYVNLASSNAAGTAWPNISVQRINGHALNMALNGTSLSITW